MIGNSVAFSAISSQKISEELASQDIPMILNSTPGVYAVKVEEEMGMQELQLEDLIREM